MQLRPAAGLSLADAQPSPAPILSLLSGSAAGSHWLRRSARERPLAAGSGPPGSPLSRRRSAARAAPHGTADGTAPGRNRGTTGAVLSSAVGRVVLWGSGADGKLPCGAPQDELQRPLKEKEKEGHLQRERLSRWP